MTGLFARLEAEADKLVADAAALEAKFQALYGGLPDADKIALVDAVRRVVTADKVGSEVGSLVTEVYGILNPAAGGTSPIPVSSVETAVTEKLASLPPPVADQPQPE